MINRLVSIEKEFEMEITTDIYLGASKEQLKLLPENSVDLVVTSPPCADQSGPVIQT